MCISVRHRAFAFGLPKPDGAHRCGAGEPPLAPHVLYDYRALYPSAGVTAPPVGAAGSRAS